jgi:hypothetical protein
MDENTKQIVASNLTIALYSAQQMSSSFDENTTFKTYEKFLLLLDAKFGITESEARPRPLSAVSTTFSEGSATATTGKK